MKKQKSKKAQSNLKPARNGKIDLLKFIFSMIVATYHFGNSVHYSNERFNKGYFAVEFFFIVSGYLFAKSLSKYDNKENINIINESVAFMKKKYVTFFSPHIVLYIATMICLVNYYKITLKELFVKMLNSVPDFLLLHMFGVESIQWLGHEWYLSSMIIVMFILTPVMMKYRKQFSLYIAPVLSLLTLTALVQKFGHLDTVKAWFGFAYSGLFRAFSEILIGCVCYAVAERGVIERINKKLLYVMEFLSYFLVIFYMTNDYSNKAELSLVYILALGVMISFSNKTSLKFLNNKFVYFLGKLSLPVYLCHIGVRSYILKLQWAYGYTSYLAVFLLTVIAVSLVFMFVSDKTDLLFKKLQSKKQ